MAYSLTLLSATLHDHAVSPLVVAGLQTLGKLSPRRAGVPAAGGTAFTTPHRMVDGVHGDAAVVRPAAQPPGAAGLAERDIGVLDVRDLPDRSVALQVDHPNLAGREPHLRVVAVLGHQPGG